MPPSTKSSIDMQKPRLDWVDAIKGMSIVLVVMGHATVGAQPYDWYGALPDDIMSALRSMRMPLFFTLSGFFFLRRVDRPWGWWIKNRITPFLYLFVLWTMIWLLLEEVGPWQRKADTDNFFHVIVDPHDGPWFIAALAIYFIIMKALRPLPLWVQITIGVVISVPVAVGFLPVNGGWNNILSYFVLFQLGAYGREWITWLADRANLLGLFVSGATWAGFSGIMLLQGGVFVSPWRIPVTIAGVAFGIIGVTLLHRWAPWLGLAWIGKKTLPIYLLHVPIIGMVYGLGPDWPTGVMWVQFGIPLLASAIAVAASLLLEAPLRKIPGVFTAPWRGEGAQTLPPKQPRQQQSAITQAAPERRPTQNPGG